MDYNINDVVAMSIAENINEDTLSKILLSEPFVNLLGTFNSRDLNDGTIKGVKPGYAFRCGSLERINDEGKLAVVDLGVKVIFDLRSLREREEFAEPDIHGIESIWQPSTWDNETTATTPQKADPAEFSFPKMYFDMLSTHKASFRSVLEHIRDHPEKPFLFHCTAGKDRTAIVAALILGLAKESLNYIDRDYSLTRVGVEPKRSFLIKKLTGGGTSDMDNPVIQAYANVQTNAMSPFFELIDDKYGSVDGYVKGGLGFTDREISQIRRNLKDW